MATSDLPVIDIAPLLEDPTTATSAAVGRKIDAACREVGFFGVVGHGVPPELQSELEAAAHEFFALPEPMKAKIAMAKGGSAWRGWFPLGGELTSGAPDGKEGLYFGAEHPVDHPRVVGGIPLHGQNLFPEKPAELKPLVLEWIDRVTTVGRAVLRGVALGLSLPADRFDHRLAADPTVLFRIFRYLPDDASGWGVGPHTDYGLVTLLAQDGCGGLQVQRGDTWIDVPAEPGVLVCNIGDMLDRLTEGRYCSTLHRVRNVSGRDRLSFPLFLDPSWDAEVPVLPLEGSPPAASASSRWDDADVLMWEGSYGDYLIAKVSNVFPELFETTTTTSPS